MRRAAILAVALCGAALADDAADAEDPWRRHNLALAYFAENAPAEAAKQYESALELAPGVPALRFNLGIAYLWAGRYAHARAALEKARAHEPLAAACDYASGIAWKREERWGEAEASLRRASEAAPADAPSWFALGVVLKRQGKTKEALMAMRRAKMSDPRHASAWYQLSTLARELGSADLAAEALEKFEALRKEVSPEEMTPDALDRGNLARLRERREDLPSVAPPPIPPRPMEARRDDRADIDNDGDLDPPPEGTSPGIFLDYDHDGWIDRLALAPLSLRRGSKDGFAEVEDAAGLPRGAEVGSAEIADFDADNSVDVIVDGKVFSNDRSGRFYESAAPWNRLDVTIVGAYSNKQGLQATVEVRAGPLWQAVYVTEPGPIRFWLGDRHAVTVRVLWPNGTAQHAIVPDAATSIAITEKGRQKTSCPLLFTWDGVHFRFVTDMLGAAFIGILVEPPDRYYQPDPDEYIRIPPGALVPDAESGRLLLRIAEQLEEVTYLDRVDLLAVDHPAGGEAFPHEQLRMQAPWPAFFTCAAPAGTLRDVRWWYVDQEPPHPDPLPAGRGGTGRLPEPLRFTGFTTPWTLEVELGEGGARHLLIDAWLRYWNSTSAYEAARNGVPFEAPVLEVPDGAGGWRIAIADVGKPAGLPKTMVVDLAASPEASRAERVRIRANQDVRIARVRACAGDDAPARIARLKPVAAELRPVGYFRIRADASDGPPRYDYGTRDPVGFLGRPAGAYTRFGDVRELLRDADDRFAILGHGEEVALEFEAGPDAVPPPRDGESRTYFLHVGGYCKEMDPHTATGRTVEPLPFGAMSRYPPPPGEEHPDPQYRMRWNTRRD